MNSAGATSAPPGGKARSLAILVVAIIAPMSLWFVSAAVLPEMLKEAALSPGRQAALSSAVQIGFVIGALLSAFFGLPDRFDPRRVFAAASLLAAGANAALLWVPVGGDAAVLARLATGGLLAGVYPVGMKIAIGWGLKDRASIVSMLIGALTFGAAVPHLAALGGGADWRLTVAMTSLASVAASLAVFAVALGPHHRTAPRFDPRAILTAWTNRKVRLAYAGYFGHMWELYSMWAWIAVIAAASYAAWMDAAAAERMARLTAFAAISAGAVACFVAGWAADRVGKAEVAAAAMAVSCLAALATAWSFGGPPWLHLLAMLVWGASIAPDSGQFSTLVADHAPPERAGSLMTLQTALGFALTFLTVQATPMLAAATDWPTVLVVMAIGPALGIVAMLRLRRLLIREAEGGA